MDHSTFLTHLLSKDGLHLRPEGVKSLATDLSPALIPVASLPEKRCLQGFPFQKDVRKQAAYDWWNEIRASDRCSPSEKCPSLSEENFPVLCTPVVTPAINVVNDADTQQ